MVALEQLILDDTNGLTIGEPIHNTHEVEYCEGDGIITRQERKSFVPVFNQGQQFIIDVPVIRPRHTAINSYRRHGRRYRCDMLLQITRCDSTCKQLYDYIITLEDWLRTAQVEVDGEQSALGHPHITKAWRPERRWKNGPLWIAQNIDIIVPTDEAGIVTVPITRYGRPYACRTMRKSSQTLPHLEEILCKGIHTSFSLYIKGFWMCYGCRGLTISLARLDTGIQLFPLERPIYNLKALKKAYEPTTAEITDTVQPVEIEI